VDGTRNPEETHHVAPRRDGSCENRADASDPCDTTYQDEEAACSSVVREFAGPDGEPVAGGIRDALEAWRTRSDARELRRRLLDVIRMLDDG
jgi:hypothetical protein